MLIKEYENARDYLKDQKENLLMNEAASQLVLFDALLNLTTEQEDRGMFGVVMEDEIPLLHFSNVPPHHMAIYAQCSGKELIGAAASLLADYMASNRISFQGLNAKQEICLPFMEQYKKSVNCTFLEKLSRDIMEVRRLNEIKPVEGKPRLAVPEEVKLITDWMINYQLEAFASEINYEKALNKATRLIEENKLYVYEDVEARPVSMAAASRQLVNGVFINYIYTPEEYRGKGYAAANIYYMSKELLEGGNQFCTLFADRNPISIRAYEKVGYRILEDNYDYLLLQT